MNRLAFSLRKNTKLIFISLLLVISSVSLAQLTPYLDIDYSIQPSLGSDNAPVKVVFFEDFTCPHCASFEKESFPKLKDEFLESGDVEFFLINMQFLGPDSVLAGIAGECVYDQDEALFWPYKTLLLESQNTLSYDAKSLATLTADISGISVPRLHICILGSKHEKRIQQDLAIGQALGVRSTPTVFVNNQQFGNNLEGIQNAIRGELVTTKASN